MKKKLFISIVVLAVFGFMISAKVSAQSYLLGMVEVNFCNDKQTHQELDLATQAGKRQDICVEITNKGEIPITLNLEFLDSIITSDNIQSRTCNAGDRPKVHFGNFLSDYDKETNIPAHSRIQKTYQIQYPIGYSGLSHGCLAYYIVGSDIPDKEMFTVRIRAIKFIDIFVGNTKPIQSITLSQSPILTKLDNEYIITFGITNEGNVPENLHIVTTLSNTFGYQKDFTFDTVVGANTGMILTTPSFIIPGYGGPYRFKSKISYTPQFNFNIIDGEHPSKLYTGGTKNIQTLLFVWTRQSRLILGILGLLIYTIFFKKRKKPQV